MKQVVLMYHGLYEDEAELQTKVNAEDRPYAVSRAAFRRQLAMIKSSLRECPDLEIVLTFDDGHISNRTMAMPDLVEHGLTGVFFITTGFMREREHFCRVDDIKALHDAGMQVGSHGDSHRFFDDMDEQAMRAELARSRSELESASGAPVCSLSFPGGRYNAMSLQLAEEAGFTELHGSKPGINDSAQHKRRSPLKRVAVRNSTGDDEFLQIIRGNRLHYTRVVAIQSAKQLLRKVLGNRLYHGLYKSVAAFR